MSRRKGSPRSEPRRPRRRRDESPRRRGPTKWLLITPLATLAVIIVGVVALEAAAPVVEGEDRRVTGLPPLAVDGVEDCVRRRGDTETAEIREDFVRGGRVSSPQVFACPSAFDELEVTYVGEVVGELIPRRGGAWAQVNDDAYALEVGPLVGHRERAGFNTGMSVWLPDGLHEEIEAAGRPGRRGDVILVRGTLLRTDPDDGGGTTVRAEEMERLAEPLEIEDPFHLLQAVIAALLAMGAIATTVWARIVRRR
jgi:hypothetical protein